MAEDLVLYEVSDGVATVTLNDAEKRNRLSDEMLGQLVAAIRRARDDADAKAVVLTGAGKAFCAGADLGGFGSEAATIQKHFGTDRFLEYFRLMPRLGKPTLCAANGHVVAGGMGLALSCDLVIAKEGADFWTPEINIGAFPYMIMALIYRNVPRKKVNEMMLLGDRVSGNDLVASTKTLINNLQPQIQSTVAELANMAHDIHVQANELQASVDEVAHRARHQVDRVDNMATSVLNGVDRFGTFLNEAVHMPLRQVNGIMAATRAVVDALRSSSSARPRPRPAPQSMRIAEDKDLFV